MIFRSDLIVMYCETNTIEVHKNNFRNIIYVPPVISVHALTLNKNPYFRTNTNSTRLQEIP